MGKLWNHLSRGREGEHRLANARRDLIVLTVLIVAVFLLIFTGSEFFNRLSFVGDGSGPELKVTATALILNVILILFGWRRYADLLHESDMRRDSEQRAALMATTDTLTGLLNRKGFADLGEELRVRADAAGQDLAILSLQLNRFKAVNDRHGYDVGDEVMRQVAASLGPGTGENRVVARLAGDEFAIAMTCPRGDQSLVDNEASQLLRSVTRPLEVLGRMVQIGAFVGAANVDPAESSIRRLLRRADIALDKARSVRSTRPVWFDEGMERAMVAHGEVEHGIRYGLEHGQFIPYFEPQIDLLSGEIIGFEVLARWDHPLKGIIAPDQFIAIAEEHGLIGRLSEQVMLAAFRSAVNWDPKIKLSVNISPTQLSDSWLAQRIVRLLTESGFPAERLVVEITESSLFSDLELARAIVTGLKNQGIRLALDDFGTGFSSLSHLRALPFDVIKIDRTFVAQLENDRESVAIVRAIATLADALGVPVTAEGIEDARTHRTLAGFGCSVGQGWYFGKPMNADLASALLRGGATASAEHVSPKTVTN